MSFDVHNFQEDVIEASSEQPVVVDFWAPWCGPCRVLGPVLEKLATEDGTNWSLVKVNSDDNPDLSRNYGIRGIPAVKMFWNGKVIDEFTGALPEHAIRDWLAKALPSPARSAIEAGDASYETGDFTAARKQFEEAHAHDPENEHARIMLGLLMARDNSVEARELVEGVAPADPVLVQKRDAVLQLDRLNAISDGAVELAESAVRERYVAAASAAADGRWEDAIPGFIEVLQRDRYYDDDGARKSCIAIFTLLGTGDAVTKKHRRTFDMALY